MERLRDNDEDWGLTRIAYAAMTRRRVQEMSRRRWENARARGAVVAVPDEAPIAVHCAPSGVWAYQVSRYDGIVTLPYVSILGEAA